MTDNTEGVRRAMMEMINDDPGSREGLEEKHGKVWNADELSEDFEVIGFMAPFVVAREKNGEQREGALMFQHSPRFYFGFTPK